MDNNIKKEALISTRDNPLAAVKGWSGIFSTFGKKSLEKKSESYREAVRIMTEIDDNIREAFKKQQQFAKAAYWANFKMDLSKFAHSVNSFFNQQLIISTLAESGPTKGNLLKLMSKVPFEVYKNSDSYGRLPEIYVDPDFDANEFTENLNEVNEDGKLSWAVYANNIMEERKETGKPSQKVTEQVTEIANKAESQAKETEEQQKVEQQKPEQEEKEEPGTEFESAANDLYLEDLVKEGFIGARHYKNLSRGKALKKSMNKIFDLMQSVLDQNAGTLDVVSHSVNVGDPDEYIKEISKLVKKSNNVMVRIVPLWNEYFKDLVEPVEEDKDENGESSPSAASEEAVISPEPQEEPQEQNLPQENQEQEPQEFIEPEEVQEVPAMDTDKENQLYDKLYPEQITQEEYLAGKEIPSTRNFDETINRLRNKGVTPEELHSLRYEEIPKAVSAGDYTLLSKLILKYADAINNNELKLKLIAVAEEAYE